MGSCASCSLPSRYYGGFQYATLCPIFSIFAVFHMVILCFFSSPPTQCPIACCVADARLVQLWVRLAGHSEMPEQRASPPCSARLRRAGTVHACGPVCEALPVPMRASRLRGGCMEDSAARGPAACGSVRPPCIIVGAPTPKIALSNRSCFYVTGPADPPPACRRWCCRHRRRRAS